MDERKGPRIPIPVTERDPAIKRRIDELRGMNPEQVSYEVRGILNIDTRNEYWSRLKPIPGYSEALQAGIKTVEKRNEAGEITDSYDSDNTDYSELIKRDDFCEVLAEIILKQRFEESSGY